VKERSDAQSAARSYESILSARYAAGGVSELALLEARRKQYAARADLSRALADRHADSAALFQAMGGAGGTSPRPADRARLPAPRCYNFSLQTQGSGGVRAAGERVPWNLIRVMPAKGA
jgi:hypothetical protein